MTISSSNRKAGPFTGNGVTVAFPFTFKVFTTSDVLAVLAVTATGVETTQVLTTNYTISLNSDQNASPGGTLNMIVAPAVGSTLTLTSQVAQTQTVDLQNNGGFYPSVINAALDKITILIQQMQTYLSGALKLPLSAPAGVSATLPTPSGGKLLGWAADGLSIENLDASGVGAGTIGATQLADGGVTTIKIADNAVTNAKLAAGAAAANLGFTPANDSAVAKLAVAQTFTAAQRGTVVALTDAANIATNMALANNFSVTLAGNRTLDNPTNQTAGQGGVIVITQDATGSRTLAYGSNWKFPSGTAPTLTTTASAVDVLVYQVESATRITARMVNDVK